MMGWNVLTILVISYQLVVIIIEGFAEGISWMDETEAQSASNAVSCQSDQTYFCINLTHYTSCMDMNFSKLLEKGTHKGTDEFSCGPNQCCRENGAGVPCTYTCPLHSYDFEGPHIVPWKKRRRKGKRRLSPGEVHRMNKVVSVKTFVIRQRDLDEWEEDEEEDDGEFMWRPSYRTFCPLIRSNSVDELIEEDVAMGTTTETSITVATLATAVPSTTFSATEPTVLTSLTPVTRRTTKVTTVATTFRPTTAIEKTLKPKTRRTTTKRVSRRTKRTRSPPNKPRKTTKPKRKRKEKKKGSVKPPITCNAAIVFRKISIPGSCQDYVTCIKNEKEHKYVWRIERCPPNEHFSVAWQLCQNMELVPCIIGSEGTKTWNV